MARAGYGVHRRHPGLAADDDNGATGLCVQTSPNSSLDGYISRLTLASPGTDNDCEYRDSKARLLR